MRKALIGAATFVFLAWGSVGLTEEEFDPEPIIEGRQSGLRDMGAAFKAISDELKSPSPAIAILKHNAQQIEELTKQQKFWFPAGTGPESEIETQAKAEIWAFPEEFRTGQEALSREARKLTGAAESGDVAAVRAQWRELGKTCKSCHDRFRTEED